MDGHVLVSGSQRAGAGRHGPTRPEQAFAAGADPLGRHRDHLVDGCEIIRGFGGAVFSLNKERVINVYVLDD